MKCCFSFLLLMLACFAAYANLQTYVGSTPAHPVVRDFLRISSTDSIDFIRWKLEIGAGNFTLEGRYGLAKPSTPGFLNEKQFAFVGELTQSEHHYYLKHKGKTLSIVAVTTNLLHLLDGNSRMLIGNGGYSYCLNNIHPTKGEEFNIRSEQTSIPNTLVFEGRTPCQELSDLLGLNKGEACNKMKWYFILYTDSVTSKPSYFLMGGSGYIKETMARGSWQIITEQNGHIVYQLHSDRWAGSLNLRKVDDNILFFVDKTGRLLVGNEDFSYTLNRRKEAYLPIKR